MDAQFKTYACILLILFFNIKLFAQDVYEENKKHEYSDWFQILSKLENGLKINANELTAAYDDYFKTNTYVKTDATRAYRRWERTTDGNYDLNGNLITPYVSKEDLEIIKRPSARSFKNMASSDNFIQLGPFNFSAGKLHTVTQGVVRALAYNKTDPKRVFLGSYHGGVWRSMDNGNTWESVTKELLVSNVKGIVIAPSNTNIVYASTDTGVIKSVNKGAPGTWAFTSKDTRAEYPGGPKSVATAVASSNPNRVLHAASDGLWVSQDGGSSWIQAIGDTMYDVEFHPTDDNIAYASSTYTISDKPWTRFYRTADGGVTWSVVNNGFPSYIEGDDMRRSLVEVSKAAPNNVWILCGGTKNNNANRGTYGLYKSTDSGVSFTKIYSGINGIDSSPNLFARSGEDKQNSLGQIGWDMAFSVSDTDPDYMVSGCIKLWKSIDGGRSFSYVKSESSKYYHMDVQSAEIVGGKTWIGTDGGINLSTDKLITIKEKSLGGFAAQTCWGLDHSWQGNLINTGLYHGKIILRDQNVFSGDGWYRILGADAYATYFNYGDNKYLHGNSYGGHTIKLPTSQTSGHVDIKNPVGPKGFKQNQMANHFYWGRNYVNKGGVFKQSYDVEGRGRKMIVNDSIIVKDWNNLSIFPESITNIHPAYADKEVIYVVESDEKLWRSDDGGVTWSNRTPSVQLKGEYRIGVVTCDGKDSNIVWCSIKGKQNLAKVLKSVDGGINWINYSGPPNNLPSYSVQSLAHQYGTDGGVYLGNSAGLWYRNNTMNEWVNYSNGLPAATNVTHIRFNYSEGKIILGTYRSIWEGDWFESSNPIAHPIVEQPVMLISDKVKFIDHSVSEQNATYQWLFPGGIPNSSTDKNPAEVNYRAPGSYDVSLRVTDSNGTHSVTYQNFITIQNYTATIQYGKINVRTSNSSDWHYVIFSKPFKTVPIVVAGAPSFNGIDPGGIRIKEITKHGFYVQFDEWEYLEGKHQKERISYLAALPGVYDLNGITMEAGKVKKLNAKWKEVSYSKRFGSGSSPVVFATQTSNNGEFATTIRLNNITNKGFSVRLQEEEEKSDGAHTNEVISYIALSKGKGNLEGNNIKVGLTESNDKWKTIKFTSSSQPLFYANIQSFKGEDPCNVRYKNLSNRSVQVKVEEEQSHDKEVTHVKEQIGYLIIDNQDTNKIYDAKKATENLNLSTGEIVLYPNPVKENILNVQGLDKGNYKASYVIINMLGQRVKQGNLTNSQIDLGVLRSGTYIVEIKTEQEILRKRFIKE